MPEPLSELEVRRALREARETAPMPAEVAERLDGVLAELVAERAREAPRPAPAPDRRRRWVGGLLAAAAVIVVGGVTVPSLLPQTDSADTARSSKADRAGDAAAPSDEALARSQEAPAPEGISSPPLVRQRRLRADVEGLAESTRSQTEYADLGGCAVDRGAKGAVQLVTYRDSAGTDRPAYLVLTSRPDGSTRARLYLCGAATPVRTLVVGG